MDPLPGWRRASIGPGWVPPARAAPATPVKRLSKPLYFTCTNKKARTSQISERKRNQSPPSSQGRVLSALGRKLAGSRACASPVDKVPPSLPGAGGLFKVSAEPWCPLRLAVGHRLRAESTQPCASVLPVPLQRHQGNGVTSGLQKRLYPRHQPNARSAQPGRLV